ncbi:MAG: FGGY-family carbohydrate kinase [Acidiferrobacter sp.]
MPPKALFVGIDLGTSGVRIGALDEHGLRYALVGRRWPLGCAMDPSTWLRLTLDLLGILRRKTRGIPIKAIAVDGTSGTVLVCAEPSGRPVTPALAYNDSRATSEAEDARCAGLDAGPAAGAYGGVAKWMWLEHHFPTTAHTRVLTQSTWLTGVLLGQFRYCDEHNALKLGFEGGWHKSLRHLDLHARPPEVVTPGAVLGPINPHLTHRLKLAKAPLVVAGTTDSIAALLALGPLTPGTGVTSLGSTLVLKIASPHPVTAPEFGIYSHKLHGMWLAGGASNSGGAVLAHYFDEPTLSRLSAEIPVTAHTHLHYYPLIGAGERFPIHDPQLAPRLTPRPADDRLFLQGLLEGLADIEARGYALLAQHGAPSVKTVVTTGGGARNEAWRTIREQTLCVPVTNIVTQPAAFGAARLAQQALSL